MRGFTTRKKIAAAIGAGAIVVAGAGTAVAFWSSSGAGDGTATTASGETNTLPVTQTSTITDLAPGVTAEGISATVKNTGTDSAQVNQVVVSIQSVDLAAGHAAGTCDSSDYTLANPTMTNAAADLASGATSAAFTGATLKFNDKLTNQDACKGATVNLHYVAS